MNIQADIPLGGQIWLTSMQAHAHSHHGTSGPSVCGKGVLGVYGCCKGIAGTRESDEEGISLSIHFVALMPLERGAEEAPSCFQHMCVVVA
jgi:hypothetical protein